MPRVGAALGGPAGLSSTAAVRAVHGSADAARATEVMANSASAETTGAGSLVSPTSASIQAVSPAPPIAPIVALDGVSRTYAMDGIRVDALRDVSLAVGQGEFVAIVGPSGSGKSTMMHIIGCLDRPTAGQYRLSGTPVAELSDDGLARLRSRTIGFVFQ